MAALSSFLVLHEMAPLIINDILDSMKHDVCSRMERYVASEGSGRLRKKVELEEQGEIYQKERSGGMEGKSK